MKELSILNNPSFEIKCHEDEYGKSLMLKYTIPFLDDEDLKDGNLFGVKYLDPRFIDPSKFTEKELHDLSLFITRLITDVNNELGRRGYIKTFSNKEELVKVARDKMIEYLSRKK